MNKIVILGLQITDRVKEAIIVQDILTKFGCSIKTRLGLNESESESCSSNGLILLELTGNSDEMIKLENELMKIEGLKVQKMSF